MLGHSRLGESQTFLHVAHIAPFIQKVPDDAEPNRMGQGLERFRLLLVDRSQDYVIMPRT